VTSPADALPRRRGLREDDIVDAALDIIRSEGVAGLTMRNLAARLGVTVGAAYKHVASKDDLIWLVANRLYEDVDHTPGESQDALARVRLLLVRFHDVLASHPGLAQYVVAQDSLNHTGPAHLTSTIAGLLAEAGIPPALIGPAMAVLFYYITGELLVHTPRESSRRRRAADLAAGLDVILSGLRTEYVQAMPAVKARRRPA
jgi:AcrR family transcriptional regulator